MAIASQNAPGVTGLCIVGTVTGDTLIVQGYLCPAGAHVAVVLLDALEALWSKLPEAIDRHGQGRFDFLIRQQSDGAEEMVDVLWHSGMSASTLFAVVARKLLKVRQAQPAHPGAHAQAGMTVTEVHDDGTVAWEQPDHTGRILRTLEQVQSDPWASLREVQ